MVSASLAPRNGCFPVSADQSHDPNREDIRPRIASSGQSLGCHVAQLALGGTWRGRDDTLSSLGDAKVCDARNAIGTHEDVLR